ncbi:MAG: iron ABC transporter permease [Alphaproteobacteria bacterium]|nr:iron ABC transporter permease [Alphaproteobacteria bacterium]
MSGADIALAPAQGADSAGPTDRRARRRGALLILLAVAAIAAALGAFTVGAYPIPEDQVLGALARAVGIPLDPTAAEAAQRDLVLIEIRAPRILFGLLVGAALGVSGAALQALFRNPLADPGLVGVSTGAALGAVSMIVFAGALTPLFGAWSNAATPIAAFIGAATVTVLIFAVGRRNGGVDVALMLLAGVAINAIAAAGIGAMTYLADDQALRSLTFWTMGSLAVSGWGALGATAAMILPAALWLIRQGGALNRYLLGEAEAGHLGVDVRRLKVGVVIAVALSVGAAVSVAGAIGFVGLVTPHLVRLIAGPDNRCVLPGAALLGAVLTVTADAFARGVAAPAEIPVGLVLSAVGGPFFLWLLLTRRWRGR